MGHGNTSDIVAIALIVAGVNFVFFQENLKKTIRLPVAGVDVPAVKPFLLSLDISSQKNTLLSIIGGLLLVLGAAFSTVKWNKRNGAMTFLGCAIAFGSTAFRLTQLNGDFDPAHSAFVLASVLLLGGLHTRFFPTNVALPKNIVKNNHGNASDKSALTLLALSVLCMANADAFFGGLGPIAGALERSSETKFLVEFCGALLFVLAMMLSAVKWNRVNGKMPGFFCAVTAALIAKDNDFIADVQSLMSGQISVPDVFFLFRAVLILALLYGGIHIFAFPSNPLIKWKDVNDAVNKSKSAKKKDTKKTK